MGPPRWRVGDSRVAVFAPLLPLQFHLCLLATFMVLLYYWMHDGGGRLRVCHGRRGAASRLLRRDGGICLRLLWREAPLSTSLQADIL